MSAARETPEMGGRSAAEARGPALARAGDSASSARSPECAREGRLAAPRGPVASGGAPSLAAEVFRALGGLALVLAAFSAALWALDGVPAWITGEPRGVRKATTVQEVERSLRTRLVLPSYFPATFAWPPSRIRFVTGAPGAVALWLEGRGGGAGLFLAETVAPGPLPSQLLPEVQVLDHVPIALGSSQGTLSRVVEEGIVVWEVSWQQGGRSMLLRSRSGSDVLVRMARSARESP